MKLLSTHLTTLLINREWNRYRFHLLVLSLSLKYPSGKIDLFQMTFFPIEIVRIQHIPYLDRLFLP